MASTSSRFVHPVAVVGDPVDRQVAACQLDDGGVAVGPANDLDGARACRHLLASAGLRVDVDPGAEPANE